MVTMTVVAFALAFAAFPFNVSSVTELSLVWARSFPFWLGQVT